MQVHLSKQPSRSAADAQVSQNPTLAASALSQPSWKEHSLISVPSQVICTERELISQFQKKSWSLGVKFVLEDSGLPSISIYSMAAWLLHLNRTYEYYGNSTEPCSPGHRPEGPVIPVGHASGHSSAHGPEARLWQLGFKCTTWSQYQQSLCFRSTDSVFLAKGRAMSTLVFLFPIFRSPKQSKSWPLHMKKCCMTSPSKNTSTSVILKSSCPNQSEITSRPSNHDHPRPGRRQANLWLRCWIWKFSMPKLVYSL